MISSRSLYKTWRDFDFPPASMLSSSDFSLPYITMADWLMLISYKSRYVYIRVSAIGKCLEKELFIYFARKGWKFLVDSIRIYTRLFLAPFNAIAVFLHSPALYSRAHTHAHTRINIYGCALECVKLPRTLARLCSPLASIYSAAREEAIACCTTLADAPAFFSHKRTLPYIGIK